MHLEIMLLVWAVIWVSAASAVVLIKDLIKKDAPSGVLMNKETAKIIVDELLLDVSIVLRSEPSRELYIWWRGRISGVVDTVKAVVDDTYLREVDKALAALIEAEARI